MLLSGILLVVAVIAAIVAFGGVNAPTTGPFTILFYFALVLFVVTLAVGLVQQGAFMSR